MKKNTFGSWSSRRALGAVVAACAAALLVSLPGCSDPAGGGWRVVDTADLTEQERDLRDTALAARDALAKRLKGRLMEELTSAGPVGAVEVCSREAATIATEVSEELGVRVGRTSHRRRSADNAPPEWAESLVAERVADPIYVRHEEGLNALLPIRVGAECLLCHGDAANMPEPLLAAIDSAYPGDAARGFSLGDLRGWFWVECRTDSLKAAARQTKSQPDAADTDAQADPHSGQAADAPGGDAEV